MAKMTFEQALQIIGIDESYTLDELKKKYRSLMLIAHPDSIGNDSGHLDASNINIAYEVLRKYIHKRERKDKKAYKSGEKCVKLWNAPINENAYSDRDIYHKVEDSEGAVIGKSIIDTGKYVWCEDEDFSDFITSIYNCSKKIIASSDDVMLLDRSDNVFLHAEIAYLLAQQFVDSNMVLGRLTNKVKMGEHTVYKLEAMIENVSVNKGLKENTLLYPAEFKNHRLYVRTASEALGYISFNDDRLYYGIIPLFERKASQVKLEVKDGLIKRLNGKRYMNVNMWIRLLEEDKRYMLESINLKIDDLLKRTV